MERRLAAGLAVLALVCDPVLTGCVTVAEHRKLEKRIVVEANSLGIGPMGFGGKTALLGAKVSAEACPSTTCFVSIAYTGWACRRQGIRVSDSGAIEEWLYAVTPPEAEKPKSPSPPDQAPTPAAKKKASKKTTKKPTTAKVTKAKK